MAINTPSTDSELMMRVVNYDSKALEVLYNRYSSILYTLIKKIVSDQQTAEEVLSDVFVIIWRKADRFSFESNNVYTWLITLSRNKAVDALRRKRGDDNLLEYTEDYEDKFILPKLSPSIDPLDIKTAMNVKDSIEKALNNLTDAQQYVIYLGYYEGLTQIEIAKRLNIPFPTVKSKITIALSKLKDNLVNGES